MRPGLQSVEVRYTQVFWDHESSNLHDVLDESDKFDIFDRADGVDRIDRIDMLERLQNLGKQWWKEEFDLIVKLTKGNTCRRSYPFRVNCKLDRPKDCKRYIYSGVVSEGKPMGIIKNRRNGGKPDNCCQNRNIDESRGVCEHYFGR